MGLLPRPCMLLLLLLLLMVPGAPEAALCTNKDPCVRQPNCTGCMAGDLVPDPDNCRGYYVCTGDGVGNHDNLSIECPKGEVFNSTNGKCEAGDSCQECYDSSPASCSYECPADNGTRLISSFKSCNYYYKCNGGKEIKYVACNASAPFFDGAECQTHETRCCHCHAFCYTGSLPDFIPDPLDCRSYYKCTDGDKGKVPKTGGTCPDGENFDPVLEECSAVAPCITEARCINVLGEDGCIDPFTCVAEGFFAKCPNSCTSEYYRCTEATGEYQETEECSFGEVFHPYTRTCVSRQDCP